MVDLSALWLPIVLSAVFVFVASSVIHMATPIHKGDYQRLPAEDPLLASLRQHGLAPGQYMFPCPSSMKDMGSPAMLEKYQKGPVGQLTVRPSGVPGIGKSLVQWFLFTLLIGLCVAYVGSLTLAPGTEALRVFRITGAIALLPYALAGIDNSIWRGIRWSTTAKFVFDGVVYALVTGAAFAWCWPAAA